MKNNFKKIKSTRLYKPVMVAALILVTIGLVYGSATVAKVVINTGYEDPIVAEPADKDILYELNDSLLTGNSRNGTLVSILKKDDEESETTENWVYDSSEVAVNGEDTSYKSMGSAAAMDDLEYNIVKNILSEMNQGIASGTLDDTKMNEISNKYDVSMGEMEKMLKQYQKENSDDAEKMKNEIGMTEKELKGLITQIEAKVQDNQTKVEQKINAADKKVSEMIANTQTLTDKQIKEISSNLGVSEKEMKDYVTSQNKTVLETATTTAETAAKAAASPKADKTYVDNKVADKITKDDLKNENVVAATLDETSGTLTFHTIN